jgi:hypothetical protein
MSMSLIGIMLLAALSGTPSLPTTDQSDITHLPAVVQKDIESWRDRLSSASCLKVVCNTEESWNNLHELDANGSPRLVQRERFEIHSWMTPDEAWVVIFPYEGDHVDTTKTLFQQYWSRREAKVWDRTWNAEANVYRATIYPCDEASGPSSPSFVSNGCIYSTVTTSWLAGPADLLARDTTVQSIALARHPNVPIVSPDPSQSGLWLDVFRETPTRDEDPDPQSLYRRADYMLLARDAAGSPELREWRTVVTSDESQGGRTPQVITARRTFQYAFHDAVPAELRDAVKAFVAFVESPATRPPAP